jgi:type I restriction enzyme S subunit
MVSKWKEQRLEDCMAAIIDYRGKTPRKTSSGIPLITAKVVKRGRIEQPDEFIAEDDYEAWMRRGIPESGDVVITTEAPLGEVAQLGSERVALAQRLIALRGKRGLLDNTFLKFLMQSSAVQDQLRARASGTTVFGIRQSELRKVTLTLPPFNEQRAIAHVLGTMDEKIELDRQISETLEGMALALFKSWFVDFDPVRSRLQGLDTGLPVSLASIFSDSFEDSEAGEIPRGWKIKRLADVTAYLNRGISPAYVQQGGVLVLNQKCIRDRRVDTSLGRRHDADQRSVSGRTMEIGDILIHSTGVGTLGRIAQVVDLEEETIVDSHVTVARPNRTVTWNFLGLALGERQTEIEFLGEGSTGQTELSRARLGNLRVIAPPLEIQLEFDRLTLPLRMKVANIARLNRTLNSIRNALLPKLISGEIRLKGTERIIEGTL